MKNECNDLNVEEEKRGKIIIIFFDYVLIENCETYKIRPKLIIWMSSVRNRMNIST